MLLKINLLPSSFGTGVNEDRYYCNAINFEKVLELKCTVGGSSDPAEPVPGRKSDLR